MVCLNPPFFLVSGVLVGVTSTGTAGACSLLLFFWRGDLSSMGETWMGIEVRDTSCDDDGGAKGSSSKGDEVDGIQWRESGSKEVGGERSWRIELNIQFRPAGFNLVFHIV